MDRKVEGILTKSMIHNNSTELHIYHVFFSLILDSKCGLSVMVPIYGILDHIFIAMLENVSNVMLDMFTSRKIKSEMFEFYHSLSCLDKI